MYTLSKSVVKTFRISESLDKQISKIASDYSITDSHLINAVLTSFCLEYFKQMIKDFSPDEDTTDIK